MKITGSMNFPREHRDSLSYKPSQKFLEIRFLLLAMWWAKAVVLEVWFLEQQHQHHLECKFSNPTPSSADDSAGS